MTPAEKVLAWLGSAGASRQMFVLDDEWTSVEAWHEVNDLDRHTDRHVAVLVPREEGAARWSVSVWDEDEDGSLAGYVLGEPGVRYLARWLVDGGRIESPYLERRGE